MWTKGKQRAVRLDEPDPVPIGYPCGIACTRRRGAVRVRMPHADQRQRPVPPTPVRREQRCRLDLELPHAVGGDIVANRRGEDLPGMTEEQPAGLGGPCSDCGFANSRYRCSSDGDT